mgnify:CR=1 FL=1
MKKVNKDNFKKTLSAFATGITVVATKYNSILYGKTINSFSSLSLSPPLVLFSLRASSNHKFGVFEVGMSKSGEINQLSKMIKPNLAIITNIAEAHIENFINIKGIAKAKSEILNNIQKHGAVILNRDDKFFNYLNQ